MLRATLRQRRRESALEDCRDARRRCSEEAEAAAADMTNGRLLVVSTAAKRATPGG